MIIKQQHWTWCSVGISHHVQPISVLLTYYTTFLLVIIIIGCVLTYLNYTRVS